MLIENAKVGPQITDLENTLDSTFIKDSTFIGRACGRSMEGVGIYDGDILIIDRSQDVKHYDVIVACYNGLFICKIADMKNNQLVSASPDYEPVKIKATDEYCVEGVVTQSIRMHRGSSRLE
ncbi:S24 family peptidase [Pseudoalteromonas sp. UBA6610]|uniref:LexA family protein n=1 Tax=Pseudoalteromonas sp. UBA6610 TaxID=1947294 RepID=UPI0025951A4B|nr:S24 family peptidase [Pseudoalteromonas sp. UBA6610]|tara:strand:+ start:5624 stop:5989 length:366 start_codon:yes stop_codon:yes gene_type:complete